MIRRTARKRVLVSIAGFAAHANAGTVAISPALAACSKALIESIAKTEPLPEYTVKSPNAFLSDLVDPNAFTVYARHGKTRALLAKASCRATPAGEIVSFKSIPLKS